MHAIPAGFTPEPDSFRNRIILITGATGGLGSAAARALAGLGATVVLAGRTVSKLEKLYDEIEAAGGPQPAAVPLNLMTATWAEYEGIAQLLEQTFGRLDGIVHAAAHFKGFTRLEDLPPRDWMDGLQVNLTAPYTLTRCCLPLLRASQDASVVFVTDDAGRAAKPYQGIYGVTKAAGEALFKTWALELAAEAQSPSGLRFNSWHPGPMRTLLRGKGYASESLIPVDPPEQAVPGLLWLLGAGSRGITGAQF